MPDSSTSPSLQEQQDEVTTVTLLISLLVLRLGAGISLSALTELKDLKKSIVELAAMRDQAIRAGNKQEVNRLVGSISALTSRSYSRIMNSMDATGEAQVVSDLMAKHLSKITGKEVLALRPDQIRDVVADAVFQGNSIANWFDRQAYDLTFRVAGEVNAGVGNLGGGLERVVRGVEEVVVGVGSKNATSLVKTLSLAIAASALGALYSANSEIVIGKMQISILDERTSDICRGYSNAKWDLNNQPILGTKLPYGRGVPRHWGCRSTIVPLLAKDAKAIGPLSFTTWLSNNHDMAEKVLGKSRLKLWLDGKITQSQLLNMSNHPISLEDMKNAL